MTILTKSTNKEGDQQHLIAAGKPTPMSAAGAGTSFFEGIGTFKFEPWRDQAINAIVTTVMLTSIPERFHRKFPHLWLANIRKGMQIIVSKGKRWAFYWPPGFAPGVS